MKFNESWLREWVNPQCSTEELVERLTMSGLEVDAVTAATEPFSGVVVGCITDVSPHPDADKLNLCQVDTGAESLQIVCGARNVRVGLKAPFARVGAILPSGLEIKAAELRGVQSAGMLCSATEVGLIETVRGLMELPDEAPVGMALRDYLQLDDTCIDVDLTPNRADCLSIRGIARDVAGAMGMMLAEQVFSDCDIESEDEVAIDIRASEACPRFLGRVIAGIDRDATTPMWMQERLRRCGLRPISPIVDVTNYVMIELGQPMHAYDRDKLNGPIGVRWSTAGEVLTLLDGKSVTLDDRTLLITDQDQPAGLAGIMGGQASAIGDQTSNLFLEVAYFDPASIIGRARDLGLHTDASHRFERGVDPMLQHQAMARATQLLIEIVGGQAGPVSEWVSEDDLPVNPEIVLTERHLTRLLGTTLEPEKVSQILENLGMTVTPIDGGWRVRAPSARFDIQIEVDLIEEVARIHGYDALPSEAPSGSLTGLSLSETELDAQRLNLVMVERGYTEVINYTFIDPKKLEPMSRDSDALPLANPLSADLSVMRSSLIPGLLQTAQYNQRRQQSRIRLFESGICVTGTDGQWSEESRFAALACGQAIPESRYEKDRDVSFHDLKGDLEALLALSGSKVDWVTGSREYLHPWQSVDLMVDGTCIGWLGAIHPRWLGQLGFKGRAFGFELSLPAVRKAQVPAFDPVPVYPSVRRDLSIVMSDSVKWCDISRLIENNSDNLLTNLVVFDEYKGPGIGEGETSLALGIVLQDRSGTLKDEQVDAVISQIVDALNRELNVELRS